MRITLNNGTVREGASLIPDRYTLYLYIPGGDMRTVFGLLIEPENTQRILCEEDGSVALYDGYTKLTAVRDEGDQITAVLEKEG